MCKEILKLNKVDFINCWNNGVSVIEFVVEYFINYYRIFVS